MKLKTFFFFNFMQKIFLYTKYINMNIVYLFELKFNIFKDDGS